MAHKFQVGEFVEFKPLAAKAAGLYKITMRMPGEFRAAGWQYRIKSEQEAIERIAYEWDLSPSIVPEATQEPLGLRRRSSKHA